MSIVLFSVGGLFALYEAYHKWHEVHEGHENELLDQPVVVGSARRAAGRDRHGGVLVPHGDRRVQQDPRAAGLGASSSARAKAPELPVVLLEDFAALIGLVLALFGVGMTLLTDNGYWDVVGTAGIGMLLVLVAIVLAIETKSLLLGESARSTSNEALIEADAARQRRTIGDVIHMRTMHVGPEELLVAVKIAVPTPRQRAGRRRARSTRPRSASARPSPRRAYIFIEPDIRRTADLAVTATATFVTPILIRMDFKVADLSLADFGRTEITLAEHEMPGLMAMRERFGETQAARRARRSPARCT